MTIVAKNDHIQIDRLELGPFGTNSYILTCRETSDCVVVDAPGGVSSVLELLMDKNPCYILMTHNHFDHVGGLSELKSALNVPIGAHPADALQLPVQADVPLNDGAEITLGAVQLKILHTPGHTAGSTCFLTGKCLIAGDTLFPGGPGRTLSPVNFRQITESLTQKLFVLPDDTQVYPGHGEATTIGKEKKLFEVFSARPQDPNLCGDVVWLP